MRVLFRAPVAESNIARQRRERYTADCIKRELGRTGLRGWLANIGRSATDRRNLSG